MNAVPAERLLRDRPALGRIVRAYSRAAGTDETAVAASLLFQAWAVSVTRPAIAGLVGARRVPDEDALFAWARARLFGQIGPLVEALHDLAPVGRRLLWGNAAAACAGGFAALAAEPGHPFDPDRLRADATRLLDWPGSPTEGLAELFPVPHGGGTRLFVRRRTCCLRYRLHDAPPTCLSCRLLPEPERRRRISLRLETEAGERAPPARRHEGLKRSVGGALPFRTSAFRSRHP